MTLLHVHSLACLDGEQKERQIDEVYTVLNAYRMKCIKKPNGKLVVEAIGMRVFTVLRFSCTL